MNFFKFTTKIKLNKKKIFKQCLYRGTILNLKKLLYMLHNSVRCCNEDIEDCKTTVMTT